MRKTTIWLWGPDVDPRVPAVIASLLGAKVQHTAPTQNDVDFGNPLATQDVLVVHAPLDEDTIERLHADQVIDPMDTHFVRIAAFARTASATQYKSIHGKQPQPVEKYAQARGYKTRLAVANEALDELVANLITALHLEHRVK